MPNTMGIKRLEKEKKGEQVRWRNIFNLRWMQEARKRDTWKGLGANYAKKATTTDNI